MGKVYDSVLELTGNTPLVRLHGLEQSEQLRTALYAKLEFRSPTRSSRDRVVKAILEEAQADGRLRAGATIVAATTGNTGVALGQWSAAKGYHLIAVLPGRVSQEHRKLLGGFGAQIVTTPAQLGYAGARERARELAQAQEDALLIDQLTQTQNRQVHYRTTGPEIWNHLDGKVDVFIAGIQTAGTVSGAGRYLKEQSPTLQVVAVEQEGIPIEDPDTAYIDRTISVKDALAREWAAKLARREGILAGLTSGGVIAAAVELAGQPEYQGKNLVVLLPDTGERYLSTGAYGDVLIPPEPF